MTFFFEEFALKGFKSDAFICGNSNSCNSLSVSLHFLDNFPFLYLSTLSHFSVMCSCDFSTQEGKT